MGLPVEQLVARALVKSPEVAAASLMEQAAQSAVRAADIEGKVPSFSVGISAFLPVNDMPAGYGTSFAMSLPWVWGAGAKQVEGAKHRANAERASAAEARIPELMFGVGYWRQTLYGFTRTGEFITINTRTGVGRRVSTPTMQFSGAGVTTIASIEAPP